jgi:aryl-alcohol dehydrogenase-like predicted oxidoreductase
MNLTYKTLGSSDLNVSNICLGTMTFGEQTSKSEAFKIMDYAFDSGINFFDTAEMYPIYPKKDTQGLTEEIIGEWMYNRKIRKKIIIATKICSNNPIGIGATELKWIRGGGKNLKFDKKNFDLAIEASLKRLKTEYIDLYQLHWPERLVPIFGQLDFIHNPNDIEWTPILEILQNLEDLKKKGKIRNFGLSNETAWGLLKFIDISEVKNLAKPVSIQNGYNLLNRVFDISLSEISIRENCGLMAYSPLAGGRLTGKYLNDKKPNKARYTLWPGRFSRHHTLKGEEAIKKYLILSQKYNLDITDLSNAFVLSRPYLATSIFGVTSLDQLKNNLNCLNIDLTNDLLSEINQIHVADPNPCV